ncbi:16527_t:CDS:2 [Acaulospora colombiana]|uniref:16527_t:CDS:1 n=1 Tax=Acaulospora colombiana TaxID=27376 RepID=A0ACA9LGD3_9GLOM|nr:16527_t:CDS:2 [Acaulospora colombiana]
MDALDFADCGNAFGEAIEFREGNPIKLLSYDQTNNEIILNGKALDVIKQISEPVAVISIGKSWFANVLHGRHDGFELGAELDGCTRGIYMWDTPFLHEGKCVIVLDCEGIDEPRQDQEWATKLFILCMAVSSSFVYNINGIVGNSDIGKLFLMTDLSKYITQPRGCKFLPRLVVLLRDFMLKNPDDFREYFLKRLDEANSEAANGVREYFANFDVYGLPFPGVQKEKLQCMDKVKTEELNKEFVSEVIHSVNGILASVEPKYIGASSMSGVMFSEFLVGCVGELNDPENKVKLSIPDEYDSVVKYVAQKSIKGCKKIYASTMEREIDTLKMPIQWSEFSSIHSEAFNESETEFSKSIIGSGPQIVKFQLELQEGIEELRESFYKKNSEALYNYNNQLAENLWELHVTKGLLTPDNLFPSKDEFEDAIGIFEIEMDSLMMPSPEFSKVMANFKSKNYKDAVDKLESLGVLQSSLAGEMRRNQEAQQKILEFAAQENEMVTKLEEMKREREEMVRQIEKKMDEMNDALRKQEIRSNAILEEMREEKDMAILTLRNAKENTIVQREKDLENLRKDKSEWQDILKTLVPVIQVGLKVLGAIFLKLLI